MTSSKLQALKAQSESLGAETLMGEDSTSYVTIKVPPATDSNLKLKEGAAKREGVLVTSDLVKQKFGTKTRYNTLTDKVEVIDKDGNWEVWDAQRISRAYLKLSQAVGANVDKVVAADQLQELAADNKHDPVQAYFKRCYEQVQPDWHTYNHLIDKFYGRSSTPFANEIMRGWLLTIVARAFKPAFYYRHCPALCGPKKVGKGALKGLAPFLSDTVLGIAAIGRNNQPPSVDQMVYVGQSSLILEVSEINGLIQNKSTNIEDVKTYFSEPDLSVDFKNHNSKKVRRTWTDYGSSNVTQFMHPEMVGRVLPISLNHLKAAEFHLGSYSKINEFRDGLWSAAMHDFMDNYQNETGFDYGLEMEAEFNQAGEQCSAGSKWETDCNIALNFSERLILSSDEVVYALRTGGDNHPKDPSRFLAEYNWIKKKIRVDDHKSTVWRWVHAERYEQAGSNIDARRLDQIAREKIDHEELGQHRIRNGYKVDT
jgi:predicted P-loop ATPase